MGSRNTQALLHIIIDMSNLDTQIDQLKDEATERWGDQWTIEARYFADGDAQCHAVRSFGRNEDGYLVQKRLFLLETGEFVVDQVVIERQYVEEEMIETPSS